MRTSATTNHRHGASTALGLRRAAVHPMPRGKTFDPDRFLPILTARKGGRTTAGVLQRSDLFPKGTALASIAVGAQIGQNLLDDASPPYGSCSPPTVPYCRFDHSLLFHTSGAWWVMRLEQEGGYEQELQFHVDPKGQANYMRVMLGQTGDLLSDRCILTVKINGVQYDLD